jgi:transcriptional regulator with XRE-family HTH domain
MNLLVEAIKSERKKLGLTQKEMADLAAMSIRNYRYMEERGSGSYKSFCRVLDVLQVKKIRLLSDEISEEAGFGSGEQFSEYSPDGNISSIG